MDSCKLGTCDALKQAEARVRELEVQSCEALAGAHAEQELSRHWKEEAYGLKSIVDAAGKLHRDIAKALGNRELATECLVANVAAVVARIADLEAQLSGVGVRQYREAVERLHKAEASVRELEATIDAMAEAHAHDDQALTAAYLSGAHAGKKQAEAFKARVMAWARGRCGACEHEGSEDDTCYNCQSDYEQSNWTPPQAWEVGE